MIGKWQEKLTDPQKEVLNYILFKCETRPTICSTQELLIQTMAELLERIHFAMAPLSVETEHAVKTKEEIIKILGYKDE